jgi:hypothetical protein
MGRAGQAQRFSASFAAIGNGIGTSAPEDELNPGVGNGNFFSSHKTA